MPNSQSSNNKRIAKNTILLYFRMFIMMAVSLYTSRAVLEVLGVEDFGIYNVVGGVVSMFSFINGSMSGATMRFITYELEKGCLKSQTEVFSGSVNVHVLIALLVVLLSETVGLWFFYNEMKIPIGRISSAFWIFQMSVISAVFTIVSVPYNAVIVAHEKMSAFAYISVLEVALKLLVVLLLYRWGDDKLVLYAIFVMMIHVLIRLVYQVYCKRNFVETTYCFTLNRKLLKDMFGFASWDLYGNMSVMARTQGVNLLFNVFFGPIINAAAGIATQVQGAVVAFANNVIMAVKPQIIKSYAGQDYKYMRTLVYSTCRISFLLQSFLVVPLILELDFLLAIWLVQVPPSTLSFCVFTLLFNLFSQMSAVLAAGIHATGNVKRISLINGSLYLAVIPLSYFAFKLGLPDWTAYAFNVIAVFLGMHSNAYSLQLYISEFKLGDFFRKVTLPSLLVFLVTISITFFLQSNFRAGFDRLLFTIIISSVVLSLLGWKYVLTQTMRKKVMFFLKTKVCKKI